eukprot:1928209-Pyramimonas_sp.AAC.1
MEQGCNDSSSRKYVFATSPTRQRRSTCSPLGSTRIRRRLSARTLSWGPRGRATCASACANAARGRNPRRQSRTPAHTHPDPVSVQ